MIIVTGGAGFIGSNIVRELNYRGHKNIIIVDDFKNSKKHLNINNSFFSKLVLKRDFFDYIKNIDSKEIEIIFHQGACTNTLEFDGNYMLENNYLFTEKLIKFCTDNNVRLVYASSAAVYGHGKKGFVENQRCENPLNIYGFSKLVIDNQVRDFLKSNKSQIIGLRYFNVYGPSENHKGNMASTIFQFYNQIKKTGKLKLFEGSERFFRDFIYVKDVVSVNMYFFENPKISGIFNCGTGKTHSFLEVGKEVVSNMENSQIENIPFPKDIEDKYQRFTKSNNKTLKQSGYKRRFTSLKKGIKEYINSLNSNGGYY